MTLLDVAGVAERAPGAAAWNCRVDVIDRSSLCVDESHNDRHMSFEYGEVFSIHLDTQA